MRVARLREVEQRGCYKPRVEIGELVIGSKVWWLAVEVKEASSPISKRHLPYDLRFSMNFICGKFLSRKQPVARGRIQLFNRTLGLLLQSSKEHKPRAHYLLLKISNPHNYSCTHLSPTKIQVKTTKTQKTKPKLRESEEVQSREHISSNRYTKYSRETQNPGDATLLWQLYKLTVSNARKQRCEIVETLENVLKIILKKS